MNRLNGHQLKTELVSLCSKAPFLSFAEPDFLLDEDTFIVRLLRGQQVVQEDCQHSFAFAPWPHSHGEVSHGRRPGPCKGSILLNEIVEVSEHLQDQASSRIWTRDPGPHCWDGLLKAPVSRRPLACRRRMAHSSLLCPCSLPFCPGLKSGTSLLASNPIRNSRSEVDENVVGAAHGRPASCRLSTASPCLKNAPCPFGRWRVADLAVECHSVHII